MRDAFSCAASGAAARVGAVGARQNLDCHVPSQRGVSRAIDLAHAAGAEAGDDLVRADSLSFEVQRW